MKKIVACLSCILIACMAVAQNHHAEVQIRKMDQHNAATLVANDTAALKKYLAPNFLLNTSGNRISSGSEQIISSIGSGRIHYEKFEVVTDTVYFINKKTAISMGSETAVSGSKGPLKGVIQKRRFTNCWVKEKNTWMLKARHSSIICSN